MIGSGVAQAVAAAAGLILAAVFLYAAVAKMRAPHATAEDFSSMGLPSPERLALIVPIVELLTAGVLVAAPGWGGVLAAALLVGFTTNLVLVIRSGRVATCACFGGTSAEPISSRHLIRNGGLGCLALIAMAYQGWIWQLA